MPVYAVGQSPSNSTIRAAVLEDFPPLYQIDDKGKPTGFAIDIFEHVAGKAGVQFAYIKVNNWAEAMRMVRSGKADVIPGIGISPARKKEFAFSIEIESVPVSCFVRAQNSSIQSIEDLSGVSTAVIAQSAAYTHLKKRNNVDLVSFDAIESALFALLSGEVDAFVFPKPVLEKKAREIGVDERIKAVGAPLVDLKRGFLVRKAHRDMVTFFDPHIEALVKSSKYQELYLKWYGVPTPFWTVGKIFLLMLFLLIAAVITLFFWRAVSLSKINRQLQENVKQLESSENAIRDQQEYLHTLQANAPDAMYLSRMDGRITDVNSRSCETLGYSREELLSMTVMEVDAAFPKLEKIMPIWESMELGVPIKLRGTHRRKDGTVFPVEVNISCFLINEERHILGFARDVSERLKMEEQLRQSHKMQAIGQLAGGIAHDFNNILGGIMGYADISLEETKSGTPLNKYLNMILVSSERAKRLVQQILTFSRRDTEKKVPVSLHEIVEEVLQLISVSLPSSIKIVTDLDPKAPPVLADSTKIHEAVMNLATNAVYAMDEKGELRFYLSKREIQNPIQGSHGLILPGVYSVVTVEDTGAGMTQRVLENIFEPFFTTKPIGEGTGMGLSVVYGIMLTHDGDILINSVVGEGTSFELYFPQSDESSETKPVPREKLRRGSEKILLVDDEEMLVQVGTDLLLSMGYTVTGTTSSEKALALFETAPEDFDLLITDQTMPEITGTDLAAKIHKIRPELPIIICTGFSKTINEEKAKPLGISGFIMKPFRKAALGREVRKVLDRE